MIKNFTYINKATMRQGMSPSQWIDSLTDPVEKSNFQRIRAEEGARNAIDPTGRPNEEFRSMFQRYLLECNIKVEE